MPIYGPQGNILLTEDEAAVTYPPPIRKTADTSRASTVTLADDPDLTHAIAASEEWYYDLTLFVTSTSSTPDIRFRPVSPAGSFLTWGIQGIVAGSTGVQGTQRVAAYATNTEEILAAVANLPVVVKAFIYVANGATPGNVTLQWAQGNSDIAATTVMRGSILTPRKIAPF